MHRFINCIADNSSEGKLLKGKQHTALIDCGMAFCAEETIRNVKIALKGRPLDYILATHTHYDHIGALPYFRKEWPMLKLVTCQAGAAVLLKDTPRRVIRELSVSAADNRGAKCDMSYDDNAFQADVTVKDGDIIPLGELSVKVLEMPGHTRDSLSYFVPELELLILNETPGVLLPDGYMYPCYLSGLNDTLNSIEKCRHIAFKHLSLPHRGLVSNEQSAGFFDKAVQINIICRDFILEMKSKGFNEDRMLDALCLKYINETLLSFQPKAAFITNAKAAIACTLRENL